MRCISCLTTALFRLKIPSNSVKSSGQFCPAGIYESIHSRPTSSMSSQVTQCKHPRVKIVAREDDAEFVECLECGDVFESSEFKDMDIEESKLKEG
jgi:Zn ribbon nucleic-acid-binding protein